MYQMDAVERRWICDPTREAGVGSAPELTQIREVALPVHFFVRFETQPGKEAEFREEMLRVNEPSRAEAGCLAVRVYESLHEPVVFAIHSEWVDEAAFERHARLPHTVRFLEAAEKLLTHPVQGLRTREIGGGAGAAAVR
jgi:quinol monooxygenase YgiN